MSNKLMPPNMALTQIRYQHPKDLGPMLAFAVVGCFQGGFNRHAPVNVSYGGHLQTPQMKIHLLAGMAEILGKQLFEHLMLMERARRRIVTPDLDQTLITHAQEHAITKKYQALLAELKPKLMEIQNDFVALLEEAQAQGVEPPIVANNGKSEKTVVEPEAGEWES